MFGRVAQVTCFLHFTGQVSPKDHRSTATGNAVLSVVKSLFPDVKNRNMAPFSPIECEQQRGQAVQLDVIKFSFATGCFESCMAGPLSMSPSPTVSTSHALIGGYWLSDNRSAVYGPPIIPPHTGQERQFGCIEWFSVVNYDDDDVITAPYFKVKVCVDLQASCPSELFANKGTDA